MWNFEDYSSFMISFSLSAVISPAKTKLLRFVFFQTKVVEKTIYNKYKVVMSSNIWISQQTKSADMPGVVEPFIQQTF